MLSKKIMTLFTASLSAGSLMLVGCTPQTQAQLDNQTKTQFETQPETIQAQQGVSDIPTQNQVADVPFVPTPQPVVDEMLRLARPTSNDVIYDLGSGDGRIIITAAQQYGARGVGIDINPDLVQRSRNRAEEAGVTDRVSFQQQDLFQTDLSEASIVTLYLLPSVNMRLLPKLLQELRPGTRIVSHNYDFGDWKPERVVQVESSSGGQHTVYYWVVPEDVSKLR